MESTELLSIGQPEPDELEITTLGPGKASGESIVVHLGDGDWMIVDSCKSGDLVLPLYYLKKIGVGYDKVSRVVCTHWHTDHVRGLPKVLTECKNAQLFMAPVSDHKGNLNRILKLAGAETINSKVWNIADACVKALSENKRPGPEYLFKNAPVFTPKPGPVEMSAIGPSDEMFNRFMASLANVNPDNPQVSQIEDLDGNLCCLALAINFHGQKILLGGDMETGRCDEYNFSICETQCAEHEDIGWCAAIDSIAYKANVNYNMVKLPHHSSENSHCPKMWKTAMTDPIAVTTAFQNTQSENHPRKAMLKEYMKYCTKLYTTCGIDDSESMGYKHQFNDIEESEDIQVVDAIEEGIGVVVCRWKANRGWEEHCLGEGSLVNQIYLDHYHV